MKKKVVGTITDQTGHTTEIKDGELYTIVFQKEGKVRIQQGCYHNYPADPYIGKDDEEGSGHGARVLFDGGDSTEYYGLVRPLVVATDKEFVAKLKKTFGF